MAQETEIKLRIQDAKAFARMLKKLKAREVGLGRVHELNLIFDTPEGGLAKHGQLLRIRTETSTKAKAKQAGKSKTKNVERTMLTFKQPAAPDAQILAGRHKVREEIEMEIGDGNTLTKIFEGLGLRGWFTYEKYRTTMKLPLAWAKNLLLELDETPIGTFLELEGDPAAIDRAAIELGFHRQQYILKSYLALYLEDCRSKGKPPENMVFASR